MDQMDQYEQKIKNYMLANDVRGEHLTFEQPCHTVEAAAKAANVTPEDLVKNICFIAGDDRLIIGIVKGEDRVSTKRIGRALKIKPPRIATPEEIIARTGYPAGGVPSFACDGQYIIDPKVMEKDCVFTGGGSLNSLIKISTKELQKINKGLVVRIRK